MLKENPKIFQKTGNITFYPFAELTVSGTGNSNRLQAIKPSQSLLIVFPIYKRLDFLVIFHFRLCIFDESFLDISFTRQINLQVIGTNLMIRVWCR